MKERTLCLALLWALAAVPNRGAHGLKLAGYDATSDPIEEAKIALEVASIKETDDLDKKKSIYQNGALARLSLNAYDLMKEDDWYNIYRYSFYYIGTQDEDEDPGEFDGKPIEQYGDTLVDDLFDLNEENIETEAALVTSVWMTVAHYLEEAARKCKVANGGEEELDLAAAYWIGWGQEEGENDRGHLLYNLAENTGAHFGEDQTEAEANKQIISRLNQIKSEIIDAGKCPTDYEKFRSLVNQIVAYMTVPLVQNLINYMSEETTKKLELYALAIVPQIAACDTAAYEYLLDKLVLNSYVPTDFNEIVSKLQSLYSCLGITCADVGAYKTDLVPQCDDNANSISSLAGYSLTTDVRKIIYIERDVVRMKNLLFMDALEAAKDIYVHGFNAKNSDGQVFSLASLSLDAYDSMKDDDWYNVYRYSFYYIGTQDEKEAAGQFDGEPIEQYGDTLVDDLFELNLEGIEREAALIMNVWMTVAHNLEEAGRTCKSASDGNSVGAGKEHLDLAAAYWIGLGQKDGGNGTGHLLYNLAETAGLRFEKDQGGEGANDRIISLMNSASDIIDAGKCPTDYAEFRSTANEAIAHMTVPLVQNLIHYMSEKKPKKVELYALAIIPQVAACDPAAHDYLLDKLVLNVYDPSGFNEIVSKLQSLYSCLRITCSDVGRYKQTAVPQCDDGANSITDSAGYSFSTDIRKIAYIDRDAVRMKILLTMEALDAAKNIYVHGFNSMDTNGAVSLASLSLNAYDVMKEDNWYNTYRYSFYHIGNKDEDEDPGEFDGMPIEQYGDTLVDDLFDLNQDGIETEAALVMNVWMAVAHNLEEAGKMCKLASDGNSVGTGKEELDLAAAYWIGLAQNGDGNDSGHLLYHMAETAAVQFGKGQTEAEANKQIISLMNQIKSEIIDAGKCPTDYTKFRTLANQIVAYMTVPLVQKLIHYMSEGWPKKLELLALAIIPQIAACDPAAYEYLHDKLVLNVYSSTDFNEIVSKLQSLFPCLGITCADVGAYNKKNVVPQCDDNANSISVLGGYSFTTDVREIAYIDRDILRMKHLVIMEALDAAKDIYVHGFNAKSGAGLVSLQELATSKDRSVVSSQFPLFVTYFKGDEGYANTMIDNALSEAEPFVGASKEQISEIVTRSAQSMVMYMYALQELFAGGNLCQSDPGSATLRWEKGVAALVGSMEGTDLGGSGNGQLMFALSQELCDDFRRCSSDGNSKVNALLMDMLQAGGQNIKNGNCNGLFDAVIPKDDTPSYTLEGLLKTALIQGTLHFAAINAAPSVPIGSTAGSLGAGHVLYSSITPLIASFDASLATTIEKNMMFRLTEKPVPDGEAAVFEAMAESLDRLQVDCYYVGVHVPGGDLCDLDAPLPPTPPSPPSPTPPASNEQAPAPTPASKPTLPPIAPNATEFKDPSTDTAISNGLYITTTYVDNRLDIAKDVENMERALIGGNVGLAKQIYRNGLNSVIYDKNGVRVGVRSLASFSTSASFAMAQEPVFNIMLFGLEDQNNLYQGSKSDEYANTIVEAAFENGNVRTLASEAAVALNLWAYVVHELYEMVDNCKNKRLTDDDGVLSLDEAVAYYIGDSQQSGNSKTGHLLYALAEKMGEEFKTDTGTSTQSKANLNILKLFNHAKQELSFADACVNNPVTHKRLRIIIHKIVNQMTVPLMQSLIFNLYNNDDDRVKLYAQAVVPLIAGCSPSMHSYLREELINSDRLNVGRTGDYIKALESVYGCLGFSCEDVGTYGGTYGEQASCKSSHETKSLAGYDPMTDVQQFARFDLDILHMKILLKKKANGAVKDIYSLGRHVLVETLEGEELLSLEKLATTSEREIVPSFSYFKRYFQDEFGRDEIGSHDNAENYGHYMIERALDAKDFPTASQEQRRKMVGKTLQSMVVYMAALQEMYDAVDDCESNDEFRRSNAARSWDRSAALLIGSLEGTEDGGSADGMMLHNLANKRCMQFGRCNAEGVSLANEELITLLYAGRGETETGNCQAMRKGAIEIESLLQVGLIQSTLHYSLKNEKHQSHVDDGDLAEGYIFSRAILPYVEEVDVVAAEVIKTNMDFSFVSKPVPDGAVAVFRAFAEAVPKMGVDCEKVGVTEGMDICDVDSLVMSPAFNSRSSYLSILVTVLSASIFASL